MPQPVNIVFIGAGNVATHLSKALQDAGNKIIQVISRTEQSAKILASDLNCEYSDDITKINPDCDLIIISVGDKQIHEVLSKLRADDKMIVHTSGSLEMNLLSKVSRNFGVFYPLQTFTKNTKVDFFSIPVLIEANSDENQDFIKGVASEISSDVRVISSDQRKIVHLAAVIVNNFTNLNYTVAEYLLAENNLPFDVLKPLIMETARKVMTERPSQIQTGPAYREDDETILKHIEILSGNLGYKEFYEVMTKAITYHKKENEKL